MAASKKSKITLFNPQQTPVVYTDDGRTVGGGERVEIDQLDATGKTVIHHELLVNETARDAESKPRAAGDARDTSSEHGAPDQEQTG